MICDPAGVRCADEKGTGMDLTDIVTNLRSAVAHIDRSITALEHLLALRSTSSTDPPKPRSMHAV